MPLSAPPWPTSESLPVIVDKSVIGAYVKLSESYPRPIWNDWPATPLSIAEITGSSSALTAATIKGGTPASARIARTVNGSMVNIPVLES